MSYTSANGSWAESEGVAPFETDNPVSVYQARVLLSNANHLRDTSTQRRVNYVASASDTGITHGDYAQDNSASALRFTTPWTILATGQLARPVLRVGAFRSGAGTSYISAAMSLAEEPQTPLGTIATWGLGTSFTNTTAAIVLEAAATPTFRDLIRRREFGRTIRRPNPEQRFAGYDPLNNGGNGPSSVGVLMVTLSVFVNHLTSGAVSIPLVQLYEFSGPA